MVLIRSGVMKSTVLIPTLLSVLMVFCGKQYSPHTVVIISADSEWRALKEIMKPPEGSLKGSPYGEWFSHRIRNRDGSVRTAVFFHGGWGKIDAAGSAQYALDRWKPKRLVNLGTAGGFAGSVRKGDIILVTRTVTYDIIERMGDADRAIKYYSTDLDLAVPGRAPFMKAPIASADQDLDPAVIPALKKKYGAVAGDWESGAIAHIAKKNGVPLFILRGVTDVVGSTGSPAYGNYELFERETRVIMGKLLEGLSYL